MTTAYSGPEAIAYGTPNATKIGALERASRT